MTCVGPYRLPTETAGLPGAGISDENGKTITDPAPREEAFDLDAFAKVGHKREPAKAFTSKLGRLCLVERQPPAKTPQ